MHHLPFKQATVDDIELLPTNRQIDTLHCRRVVTFCDTITLIPTRKDQTTTTPLSQLWYSKKESSCMRRECAVFSKHYKRLCERASFNQDELLGLEDATLSRQRISLRKLTVQSILLQQGIHRALHVEDSTKIAAMMKAYSAPSREQALERARKLPIEQCNYKTPVLLSPTLSSGGVIVAKRRAGELQTSSQEASSSIPCLVCFSSIKESHTVPNEVSDKHLLPSLPQLRSTGWNTRQQNQTDLYREAGASVKNGIHIIWKMHNPITNLKNCISSSHIVDTQSEASFFKQVNHHYIKIAHHY